MQVYKAYEPTVLGDPNVLKMEEKNNYTDLSQARCGIALCYEEYISHLYQNFPTYPPSLSTFSHI